MWVPGKQIKNMKQPKTINNNPARGYTVLELSVAAAIMVSLTAIATPSVLKFMQDGQVDEAKALLNTAIAECLSKKNQGITSGNDYTPESLAIGKPLPGKYTYNGQKNANNTPNCSFLQLEDTTDTGSRLTTLIADLSGTSVVKSAVAKHPDSKPGCESWGTCLEGGDIERLRQEAAAKAAEQARLAKIELDYSNWLKAGNTGNYREDGKDKWAYEGREVGEGLIGKGIHDGLVEAKVGKEAMANYKNWLGNPPINTGCYDMKTRTTTSCTTTSIDCKCVFKGAEVADKGAVAAATYNDELNQFNAKVQEAKTNRTDGRVTLNGHTKWTYNGNEYATEALYTAAKPQQNPGGGSGGGGSGYTPEQECAETGGSWFQGHGCVR